MPYNPEITELNELNRLRNQESWECVQFAKAPATSDSKEVDSWKIKPIQHRALGSFDRYDAHFIAKAPRMLEIINEKQQKLTRAEEAIKYLDNAVEYMKIRLAQIGSEDYKACGENLKQVCVDAIECGNVALAKAREVRNGDN